MAPHAAARARVAHGVPQTPPLVVDAAAGVAADGGMGVPPAEHTVPADDSTNQQIDVGPA